MLLNAERERIINELGGRPWGIPVGRPDVWDKARFRRYYLSTRLMEVEGQLKLVDMQLEALKRLAAQADQVIALKQRIDQLRKLELDKYADQLQRQMDEIMKEQTAKQNSGDPRGK